MTTRQYVTFRRAIDRTAAVVLALGTLGALSACSSEEPPSSQGQSAPSQTASAPTSGGAEPGGLPGHSPSASDDATQGGTSSPSGKLQSCTTDQLQASLGEGGGGAAGHSLPVLLLTNTSDTPCTLTGYPGVSFVGDNDGTQLGAPAERDESGPPAVTIILDPGTRAQSQLDIIRAENYPASDCQPQPADGLRVYPPDQKDALFIQTGTDMACSSEDIPLISVRPFEPAN